MFYPDERIFKEIALAVFYAVALNHGTDGHGRLVLINRLARQSGQNEAAVIAATAAAQTYYDKAQELMAESPNNG